MSDYANPALIRRDVIEQIRPPVREPLSQSASRLLKVELSGAMVPWDRSLVPYMHEPMDCLQSRQYDAVVFAGPARTAKTVSLLDAWIMHTIVNDPADFLAVQISQEKAAEYSKKRLSRSMNASAEVRAQLSPRSHDNNVHEIVFKRGNFLKLGWPSKNIFASSDWKRVGLTDYDRMVQNIGGEGSGFILAGKRTQTFMSSGMVLAESSPGFLVTDPSYKCKGHEAPPTTGIMSLFNQGDRRLFHWQCPDCGDWYEPDFNLLQYDKDEPDPYRASKDVFLMCPFCSVTYRENSKLKGVKSRFKLAQNEQGLWVPEGCHLDQNRCMSGERRESRIASFWQKGPTAAFQTWNQLVYKYLAAQQEYEKTGELDSLQATVNTDQGWPFTPPRDQEHSTNELMERRTELGKKVVPEWVRFLLASVDVQSGKKTARWDVLVLGFGPELETIVIDRFKIEKALRVDPNDEEKFVRVSPGQYLEDWDLITERVVKKKYRLDDDSDRFMPVHMTAIDSGGEDGVTDNAYAYYRKLKTLNLHHRVMLVKGGSNGGDKVRESFPDNSKRSDRKAKANGDIPLYILNTDKIKDVVTHSVNRSDIGRRYVHFPLWLSEWFFDELTAENRCNLTGKWSKPSSRTRNETLDLFVYIWACIFHKKADLIDWASPPAYALPINENSEIISGDGELKPMPRRRRRR